MVRYLLTAAAFVAASLPVVAAAAPATPSYIIAAVADASRPDADRQRDQNRKPAETLAFADIKPGIKIAELLPGAGYFTRIFSKAVGERGHVYAIVPRVPPDAPADTPDPAARINLVAKDAHYANVSVVVEPFSELATPAPVDLVWTSQNYHDLHNMPGLDLVMVNKMIFDDLKPGGIYLIVDHAADAGSGGRDTATLHRIDPETVKKEVMAAGFEFVGSSDLLRQPADTHVVKVFDPSVRGRTDQFILKFRKPRK